MSHIGRKPVQIFRVITVPHLFSELSHDDCVGIYGVKEICSGIIGKHLKYHFKYYMTLMSCYLLFRCVLLHIKFT